jgi:hypothetical protein
MGTEKRGTLKEVYTKVEVFRENIEKRKIEKKKKKEKIERKRGRKII